MIINELYKLKDDNYKKFHSKLIPNINSNLIIGVRVPLLKKLVKNLNSIEKQNFIKNKKHKYYDENMLHALIISDINDYTKQLNEVKMFLKYVDNWAVCDSLIPKTFLKNKDKLIGEIYNFIKSSFIYEVRFGIKMLMTYYLDDDFDEEYLKLVSEIKSDEYYINMMRAWFFQTALVKKYDCAIGYIKDKKLDKWTHNKCISKCIDSNRFNSYKKAYLKTLKV